MSRPVPSTDVSASGGQTKVTFGRRVHTLRPAAGRGGSREVGPRKPPGHGYGRRPGRPHRAGVRVGACESGRRSSHSGTSAKLAGITRPLTNTIGSWERRLPWLAYLAETAAWRRVGSPITTIGRPATWGKLTNPQDIIDILLRYLGCQNKRHPVLSNVYRKY